MDKDLSSIPDDPVWLSTQERVITDKTQVDKNFQASAKAMKPKPYEGSTDPQEMIQWITRVNQYFDIFPLAQQTQARVAVSMLEDLIQL